MRLLALLAFVGFSLAALPAAAEDPAAGAGQARLIPVQYADLDPAEPQDAAVLLTRLTRAADAACAAPDVQRPSPAARRARAACRDAALDEAVAELAQPELTRLHAEAQR